MSDTTALTSKDMANTSLVNNFKASLLPVLETEKALWLDMYQLMLQGDLSVRGCKATIDAVNAESGSLPTIKTSQSQYILKAGYIHSVMTGASEVSLSDLLNTTIQGTRKMGVKRFDEAVAEASTFSALAKKVDKVPAKETTRAPKIAGVEGFLIALSEAMADDDFDGIIEDKDLALAVAKQLTACARLASVA